MAVPLPFTDVIVIFVVSTLTFTPNATVPPTISILNLNMSDVPLAINADKVLASSTEGQNTIALLEKAKNQAQVVCA